MTQPCPPNHKTNNIYMMLQKTDSILTFNTQLAKELPFHEEQMSGRSKIQYESLNETFLGVNPREPTSFVYIKIYVGCFSLLKHFFLNFLKPKF